MKCIARCTSNPFKQCSFNIYNNNLCKKHYNKENIKTIHDDLFTEFDRLKFIKEYLYILDTNAKKSDILIKKNIILAKYILQYYNYNFNINLKNKDVICLFKDYISTYKKYLLNINKIIKIQSIFRTKYTLHINKLKGPGLFNRNICTNQNDFYTFLDKNEINYNYFFSFKDDNSIYCFDIRSFKLLIENFKSINPYNRNSISDNIKTNAYKIIKYLNSNNSFSPYEDDILTEEQEFNQNIIKIFQKIDSFGYNTDINWFKNLSLLNLKKFWINLEDIWNYRSNLSNQQKNNIIRQNLQQPFHKFKFIHSFHLSNKKTLQNCILDDINIFISSGVDNSFSNIGCLYVLTALSAVSNSCLSAMPWLHQYFN